LKTCKEKLNIAVTDIHSILETAAFIKESCELSLKVLNDALTFDKIDGNMINLELEEVELIPFVDSIIESYKSHDESSKVQILSKFVDIVDNSNIESFILKADKIKIRQVLSNFISNALKFTQSGEINIVVELKKIPVPLKSSYYCFQGKKNIYHNERIVRISVIDTGCGVSLEQQPTIFNQYVQFNANKLQQGNGTGLGLWISRSKL
jgi:signal transduction histidine kinase